VTDFLRDPALPPPLDLSMIDSALLADTPDRVLALATDLLLSGDAVHGGEYLDVPDRAQPSVVPGSNLAARFAAARSLHYMLTGRVDEAVAGALAVRAIQERRQLADEWDAAVPLILLRVYTWLEEFEAVEREAAALAAPQLTEPVKLVMVAGPLALAWFEAGRLAEAAANPENDENVRTIPRPSTDGATPSGRNGAELKACPWKPPLAVVNRALVTQVTGHLAIASRPRSPRW
jgi:LuxR family transcriptional regulator, maltose regulon positive regulatory protein